MRARLFQILLLASAITISLPAALSLGVQLGLHESMWQDPADCKLCHQAYSAGTISLREGLAAGAKLCFTCHGDGTGAFTDVRDGLFTGPRDAFGNQALMTLNGGGFEVIKIATRNIETTSSHRMDIELNVWGSKNTEKKAEISCVACHDPHMNKNYRWQIASNNILVASNEDGFNKGDKYRPSYTTPRYRSGQSYACLTCHDAYSSAGQLSLTGDYYDANDGKGMVPRYHHPVGVPLSSYTRKTISSTLPLDQSTGYKSSNSASDQMQCLTCHRAHGTAAAMRGFAAAAKPSLTSSLLRLDNRDICQDCHNL